MSHHFANPAPLGLMGFGMTTILLNLHNAGFFPLNATILAMGLCFGGLAQILAGILEYPKGNTFGVTAFTSYGFFWISLVCLILMPKWGWADATSGSFMGCYLLLWGIFTLFMFFGTLTGPRTLQVLFALLTVLFFLLAAADLTGNENLTHFAGYEGIVCGSTAIYLAMAEVLNHQHQRSVLPI